MTPLVSRLILQDFRSYGSLDLAISRRLVALVGENGAGKTNLAEAVSLFAQGRGLRRAELGDMVRTGALQAAISITLAQGEAEHRLGVGLAPDVVTGRLGRQQRLDGAPAAAAAFAEHVRVVWLTPDLDGLFRGTPGDRRRFLDRLVLAVDARHGARVAALERALRSRNRLLEEGNRGNWLDAAERELSELAVAVALARRETAMRLDSGMVAGSGEPGPFPFARLRLAGAFEDLIAAQAASDAEERYRAILHESRARDAAAGRTLSGPQASDLLVRHGPKDLPAATCSTGEQKALLLRLVLAHAHLVEDMSGLAPIVILDEVAAHLDPGRRAGLYEALERLGGQVWMTGADPGLFDGLDGRADIVRVTPGRAEPA